MTDDSFLPYDDPTGRQQPAEPLPPLGHDLVELAWLQCSDRLSRDCTGYVCAALLQWSLGGESWPDPAAPAGGPGCDHLEALEQISTRLSARIQAVPGVAPKFQLARVGRELNLAIRCQRDPAGLSDSLWREAVHRQPWLAGLPLPLVYDDGSVL
ncbi:MAG: hypothetical protein ACR2K2_01710 [Mycobacteriales bacterium]